MNVWLALLLQTYAISGNLRLKRYNADSIDQRPLRIGAYISPTRPPNSEGFRRYKTVLANWISAHLETKPLICFFIVDQSCQSTTSKHDRGQRIFLQLNVP